MKLIKLTHNDETIKRAHDLQIVAAKDNSKVSHGGFSRREASGTNQRIKALSQGRYCDCGPIHRRAIKEETIALRRE